MLVFLLVLAWNARKPSKPGTGQQKPVTRTSPAKPKPVSKAAMLMGAWGAHKQAVERRLKAPRTVEWPSFYDPGVRVKEIGADVIEINAFVDSQNGFGAQVRTFYTCRLTPKDERGDAFTVLSFEARER